MTSDLPSAFCPHHSDICVSQRSEALNLVWSATDNGLTIIAWPTHSTCLSWHNGGVKYGSSDGSDQMIFFGVLNFA